MFTETLFPVVRKQRLFSALMYFKTEIFTFLKGVLNGLRLISTMTNNKKGGRYLN